MPFVVLSAVPPAQSHGSARHGSPHRPGAALPLKPRHVPVPAPAGRAGGPRQRCRPAWRHGRNISTPLAHKDFVGSRPLAPGDRPDNRPGCCPRLRPGPCHRTRRPPAADRELSAELCVDTMAALASGTPRIARPSGPPSRPNGTSVPTSGAGFSPWRGSLGADRTAMHPEGCKVVTRKIGRAILLHERSPTRMLGLHGRGEAANLDECAPDTGDAHHIEGCSDGGILVTMKGHPGSCSSAATNRRVPGGVRRACR